MTLLLHQKEKLGFFIIIIYLLLDYTSVLALTVQENLYKLFIC